MSGASLPMSDRWTGRQLAELIDQGGGMVGPTLARGGGVFQGPSTHFYEAKKNRPYSEPSQRV